jgi:hypothetical protein
VIVVLLGLAGCGGSGASQSEKDQAIKIAGLVYNNARGHGVDFANGPCISERMPQMPDWVVDVAHDPRQPVDDEPANQCASFREGRTHHFVELTLGGRLIRAQ